ncbi:MAG: TVP38/TMEM64 family protein [Thermoproteota archaeon]
MRRRLSLAVSIIVIATIIIINMAPRLFSGLFKTLIDLMISLGLLGFCLLMVVQSIVAVIPAEALLILGGSAFGTVCSATVGTLGLMTGALVNYLVGLKLGRPIVERLVGSRELDRVERLFRKHGSKIIFAARFIPWISFDAVSYFAGAAAITMNAFLLATLLGTIPRSIFYSYVGEAIGTEVQEGDVTILNYLLIATLTVIVLVMILSMRRPSRKYPEEAGEASR